MPGRRVCVPKSGIKKRKPSAKTRKPRVLKANKAPKQQYRCTLNPLHDVFKVLRKKLQSPHLALIRQTPFHLLLEAFYSDSVVLEKHTNMMLDDLITSYTKGRGFRFGSKYYLPTREDIRLIFGIKDGSKTIGDFSSYPGAKSSLRTTLFFDIGRLRVKDLKAQILVSVSDPDPDAVMYTVMCLCLLLIGSVFFSTTGNGIAWHFCYFVDNLDRLCSFDWSGKILTELIDGLDRDWSCPRYVNGCTLFLLYWFCEHTSLVPDIFTKKGDQRSLLVLPGSIRGIPRITKWNLKDLQGKLSTSTLNSLSDFTDAELCPTANENMHLSIFENVEGDSAGSFQGSLDDVVPDSESLDDTQQAFVEDQHLVQSDCGEFDICLGDSSGSTDNVQSDEDPGTDSDDPGTDSDSTSSAQSESDAEFVEPVVPADIDSHSTVSAISLVKSVDVSSSAQKDLHTIEEADGHPIESDQSRVKSVDEILYYFKRRPRTDRSVDPSVPSFRLLSPTPSPVSQVLSTANIGALNASSSPLVCYSNSSSAEDSVPKVEDLSVDSGKGKVIENIPEAEVSIALVQDMPVLDYNVDNLAFPTSSEDYEKTISDLSDELALLKAYESRYVDIKQRVDALEAEHGQCKDIAASLRKEADVANSKYMSVLKDANESSVLLKFKSAEIEELKLEREKLISQLADVKTKNVLLDTDVKRISDTVTSKIAEAKELKEELLKSRGQITDFRGTIALKDSFIKELEVAKHQAETEVKDLSVQVQSLTLNFNDALSSIVVKDSEIHRLQGLLSSLETSLSSLTVPNSADNMPSSLIVSDRSVVPTCNMPIVSVAGDSVSEINGGDASLNEGLVVGDSSIGPYVPVDVSNSPVQLTPDFLALSKSKGRTSGKKMASLERRVKHFPRKRPANKDDIFSYSIAQKKQKTTVLNKDPGYDIPPENPVDSNDKLVLFDKKEDYACGPYILPEAYARLVALHKESDRQALVWAKSLGDYPWIYLPSILYILNNLLVDELVLEGVIHMLRERCKGDESIFFVSTSINAIIAEASRDKCFKSEPMLDFIRLVVSGKRLFVPLCLYGTTKRPYHWVVLSYKLGDASWKLFNSVYTDGRCGDVFLEECQCNVQIIVGVVEHFISQAILSFSVGQQFPSDKVKKARNICLQDDEHNCALFVAFYIYKLCQNSKIPRTLEDVDVQKWKGAVVNSLVLNNPHLLLYEG